MYKEKKITLQKREKIMIFKNKMQGINQIKIEILS